ncbi:SIR2 family protein [Brevundimonas sp. Leaf168]|uniref:SIR2 family protein n=1 Tax=Brevundimonas sp. Leaf168 TaxID=1736283 RepID=UPI00138ED322|nr:SIR2 family protein [Brevundimonas sp. Leaf168]
MRLFQMRATQVMWLLGAGASRTAGVKTAWDVIWDLKHKLYCSQKKLALSAITDLSDTVVQRKIQEHFDSLGSFPSAGAEDEYSAYFEAAYPSARDRRQYLDGIIEEANPSFGHRALALLMRENLTHTVWTTNFDKLVEDSAAKIYGSTGRLTVADLGEPSKLQRAMQEGRWPVLGKLHGDFHSDRLKNTNEELRDQDAAMRQAFVAACQGNGLALVGYSGRDTSIIAALTDAINGGAGFPGGLFWFKRSTETPFEGVTSLMKAATDAGIEAFFVEVETFDELMSDLVRFLPTTTGKVDAIGEADRPRLGKAPLRAVGTKFPVVRTNALPIISWPTSCRLVVCTIGGVSEVVAAVKEAGVDLDVNRVRAGVLAFGRDVELRTALADRDITSLETYAISPARLRYESGERTLIRDALVRSLGQRETLAIERRGRRILLRPAAGAGTAPFNRTVACVETLTGVVPGTTVAWNEACEIRLDWKLDGLWLLLEPRVVLELEDGTAEAMVAKAKDWVRERRAQRRNKHANSMLDGWIELIVGTSDSLRLRAFGISDGADADFEIARTTGFSGRAPQ